MLFNWYKTCYLNNFGKFKKDLSINPKEYIKSINKKEVIESRIRNEIKKKRFQDDYYNIEDIVNLIIDISEEAYQYQNKTKKDFINLPEYQNWIELFIEGKTCIKIDEAMISKLLKKKEEEEEEDDNEINNNQKDNKEDKKMKKLFEENINMNEIKKEKIKKEIKVNIAKVN